MAVRDVVMAAAGQGGEAIYVDDVFSTYLYTGNGSTQTINNGIDLAGKGGLVWFKRRSSSQSHYLSDTARGVGKVLSTDTTTQELNIGSLSVSSFNADGFGVPSGDLSTSSQTYASWTFRKAEKFFDVVTYTGNGVAGRQIAHNLGSVPGCIIVKCTSNITDWAVYHRSLSSAANALQLNTTGAQITATTYWNSTAPTSSVFTVGADNDVNATGRTYVAYLFAHDAGGFGATGTDNVISCGAMSVGGGVDAVVTLGWEPQWVMFKQAQSGGSGDWRIVDNMRGVSTGVTSGDMILSANTSNAEADAGANLIDFTSTGFIIKPGVIQGGNPYIYIAIRRPMKPPTSGTQVYNGVVRAGTGANATLSGAGFPPDLALIKTRGTNNITTYDRLRGAQQVIYTNLTDAEATDTLGLLSFTMDGASLGTRGNVNASGQSFINWMFRRAPGFFDVVCYTGTGAAATLNHNLTVAPELVFVKGRTVISNWETYVSSLGGTNGNGLALNDVGGKTGTPPVGSATATTFTLNNGVSTSSGQTYVAYLFATLPGISKVGSYTGNGSSQTINCGFAAGARFFLVKATSTTGSWWVYDSARGIVAAADPALQLNSTAAEVTSADAVDPTATGIIVNQEATCSINANGVSYIFLAIA